jgi:hypothetical protein
MGLFKSIAQAVRKPVASVLGGHTFTAAAAKVTPKALGIKSAASRSVVAVTQKSMAAAGISAVGGKALMSANTIPAVPSSATTPVDQNVAAMEELFIRHLMKG